MSRFSESPSPQHDLYEQPPTRGRRGGGPPPEDDGGYDDRWIGRSRSGPRGEVRPVRGRGGGGAYLQQRSRSRSMQDERAGAPRRRRRHPEPRDLSPPLDDQHSPPPRHRRDGGDMRRRERPRPTRHGGGDGGDAPRDRGRDRGRETGGRRGREQHEYSRKMAEAQQASMRSMMQGMMGMGHPAAMQMAMMQQMGQMGMVHPSYMHAMQQQQQMMLGKHGRKAKQRTADGGSSSDSGSSSSSESGGPGNGVPGHLDPRAAMAAMMAGHHAWPGAASAGPPQGSHDFKPPPGVPPPPPPPPPPGFGGAGGGEENIEAFLANNPVSQEAIDRLRSLPSHLQAAVMRRGPVMGERNPSQTLMDRVKYAEMGQTGGPETGDTGTAPVARRPDEGAVPARKSAKAAIEKMIEDYRLDIACAWTMRALAPDKQKLAARIDPSGQADPSGYVAEELKKIV